MDEVLADTLTAQIAWFHEHYGYNLSKSMLAGRHLAAMVDAGHFERHEACLGEGDFFADLPVMPGSQNAVEEIARHHDVFVASAATEYPRSCACKFSWSRRYFPMIPPERIVFCGDKSILAADILVDDNCRHFRRFAGRGMLFSAPHNLEATGWPRLRDWDDARAVLLRPDGCGVTFRQ
jgi:5'(3')-deoxyribonucleotidase